MRAFASSLLLVFLPLFGPAQAQQAEVLIDPAFTVPDRSGSVARLEDRFRALAERLRAMLAGEAVAGVDARLEELFLPEKPEAFRRRYFRELRLAERPGDLAIWLELAQSYLQSGKLDDAADAAYPVWRQGREAAHRASALALMAEAALAAGEVREAINLYRLANELAADDERQRRYDTLLERLRLQVTDVAIDVERPRPSACVVFSQELTRRVRQAPEDFIVLEPAQDVDISARERQICIGGLRHGAQLELLVKPGVTGAAGGRLYAEARRQFTVPDRAERVAFTRGAYVLPVAGKDTLPMTTVNLQRVFLALYRVDDRNLANVIGLGMIGEDINWGQQNQLGHWAGAEVWRGEVEVAERRNEEVVTLLPVSQVLGPRKPGIYALVGSPPDDDGRRSWQAQATQWLVVSDLGLTAFEGEDGLHVLVRSLATTEAVAAAELTLVARNNTLLATARSDADGMIRFAPGFVRGRGGDRAAVVVARHGDGDYNFLRLAGSELDLSERGVAGRPAPQAADAFLYTDRGVYRPGESVHLGILLRDQRALAMAAIPLTVKVRHPGGTEVFVKAASGDGFGGYGFEVPLAETARAGTWSASAYLDAEAAPVGSVDFLVEDFVPPRLEVELTSEAASLAVGERAELKLRGAFFYGAPAAGLEIEAQATLSRNPKPYPAFAEFTFGLVQEPYRPQRLSLAAPPTDGAGESHFELALDAVPDTTHPLLAEVRATLIDVGGRPVSAVTRLPLRTRAVEIGLRPRRVGGLGAGEVAGFELVALDHEATGVPGRRIAYQWIREHYDYSWYQSGGQWQSRVTVSDELVAAGELALDGQGRGGLERPLGDGRYRFEIADLGGDAAASYRFYVGWWASSQLPDVPDALDLALRTPDLGHGESLRAFVKAPFAGTAVVVVMSDRLHHVETLPLPAEGTEISLAVDREWGPGAYLSVTALRPDDGTPTLLPRRAMGLAWFSIDRAKREVAVSIEAPETALPRRPVTIPLRLTGAAGRDLRLTLAAVDEGILRLTAFTSPDPRQHYYGQHRLGVSIYDLYGRLISAAAGQVGRLRSGGDAAMVLDNVAGPRTRTVKSVALYRRDISVDADGRAEVTLDLPDFNGRLRLMAVAYGAGLLGAGEADLVVRDPLIAEVLLPRFLAPGDEAQATLSLHNLSGGPITVDAVLSAAGAIAIDGEERLRIELADQERREQAFALKGTGVGDGHIRLTASAPGLREVVRAWDIAVRSAWSSVTQRHVTVLEPGQTIAGVGTVTDAFLPGTLTTTVAVSARPEFDAPALLAGLRLYPYGCTEQTVSQALPLLYAADLAESWGESADGLDLHRTVDRAIRRSFDRQRYDGAFGPWQSFNDAHPWLTAYVFDFLTQARERGFDVPPAAYEQGRAWLQRFAGRRGGRDLYAQAYALYVLARIGAVKASDVRYFVDNYADGIRTRLGLGHAAAALAVVGEARRAEALFEAAIRKRRPPDADIHDYGSDLRDGAAIAALLAQVAASPARSQGLVEALERQFDRTDYFSTQEQAWLLLAARAVTGVDAALRVEVDGQAIGPRSSPHRRQLRADEVDGLRVRNAGAGPLRVIESRRGVPSVEPPAAENGFALRRSFFTIDGAAVALDSLRQNDQVVVLIEGEARLKSDHEALVVDLLPAGFEIENAAIGGDDGKRGLAFLPALTPTLFEAARDDRYVAAINLYGSQRRFAVAYLARAVTPGRFVLPGSFVEDMYKPQYNGRLAAGTATIRR